MVTLICLVSLLATPTEVQHVLRRFSHEPTVLAAQSAALKRFRLRFGREKNWLWRVRLAPLLPYRFQVRYGNDFTSDLSITENGDKLTNRIDSDRDRKLQFIGEWNLGRLIFNPDELKVADRALALKIRRQKLLLQVTRIYFARRRLQVRRLLAPPSDRLQRLGLQLKIQELTAMLNGLCGGLFKPRKKKRN